MAQLNTREKLAMLADAAKYDASCASSGTSQRDSLSDRGRGGKGIGSTEGMGICHAYAPDGRCISLLKLRANRDALGDRADPLVDRVERLAKAGIDRAATYVTDAVKHFKFVLRGKRRVHQTPDAAEITACRWRVERAKFVEDLKRVADRAASLV